jgi:hypothetical protein
MDSPSIHAVVRSCGERTEALCSALVQEQLPTGASLSVVSGVPFEKTLRACYETAIDAAAEWTLTIDADLLLAPGSVERLLRLAKKMPLDFLQLEARAFDQIQGRWREVGHRIYRTELLPKALAILPAHGELIRPESATIKRLGAQGHRSRMVDVPVGLHDFEQYRGDLYRKAFTHAAKHRSRASRIIERCAARRAIDDDYLVMLRGVWDGLLHDGPVQLDADAFRDRAATALDELGLAEKPGLDAACWLAEIDIETRMREVLVEAPPPIFAAQDEPPREIGPLERVLRGYRYRLRTRGLIGGNLGAIGAILRGLGGLLDR